MAPLNIEQDAKMLSVDLHQAQSLQLFTDASEIEDSPANLLAKYNEAREEKNKNSETEEIKNDLTETVFASYLLLNQQVRFIHQKARPFMPLNFVIEFGGLALGLLILGYLLTRLAQAKTLFIVKFTEDLFHQAVNSPTKFDQASDLIGP